MKSRMQPIALALLLAIALPAAADARSHSRERTSGLTPDAINAAEFTPAKKKDARAANIKAQVLLDRASFSPGAIDGRDGDNFHNALRGFQKKNGLSESGKLDQATWDKLVQSAEAPLIEYTITDQDAKGPFADKIPKKLEDMAELKRLDYVSALEMLAERFHMSEPFLKELNRGKDFDKAGTVIAVANVNVKPVALETKDDSQGASKAAKIEVDKTNNIVRVLAEDGALIASYPATVGSEEKPAPSGTLKVVRVAEGPTYTYDPKFQFKGVKATEKLKVAAGPNNPVGSVWIALDQKSYGIHGTPDPTRIGKTESHGCVRLTNWDALALAKLVRKGMPVDFID